MTRLFIELSIFLLVWSYEMLYSCSDKDLYYFVWKFSTLTWITFNLTMLYFICCIIGIRRSLKSFLFLASYSLTCVVVLAYWVLYSIKPSLVDKYKYESYDLGFLINLFIHGGNLIILTFHSFSVDDYRELPLKALVCGDTFFISTYLLVQKISRLITGISVYGFLEEMNTFQLIVFNSALYFIAVAIKIVAAQILIKRTKGQ